MRKANFPIMVGILEIHRHVHVLIITPGIFQTLPLGLHSGRPCVSRRHHPIPWADFVPEFPPEPEMDAENARNIVFNFDVLQTKFIPGEIFAGWSLTSGGNLPRTPLRRE